MTLSNTGNVGIGSVSPDRALEVAGNNNGGAKANYIRITDTDTTATANNQAGGIEFFTNDVTAGIAASIEVLYAGSGGGGEITFNTNASSSGTLTEALRINESGNVGIGMSPAKLLDLQATDNLALRFYNGTSFKGGIEIPTTAGDMITGSAVNDLAIRSQTNILFATGGNTERMRINSAGNVGIGATPSANWSGNNVIQMSHGSFTSSSTFGAAVSTNIVATASGWPTKYLATGAASAYLQAASDGSHLFYTAASGSAGASAPLSERMRINAAGSLMVGTASAVNSAKMSVNGNATTFVIHPAVDNNFDCGHPSYRWDDIRATNGTIQTSDRNEKQDIEARSEAEQRVAVAAKVLMRKFRWISSVQENGDNARIHFGIIAQDLQDAFTAEGLDAGRYAMFISDTWWETQTEVAAVEATEDTEAVDAYTRTDTYDSAEEAPEGATERTRLGVRYSELLAFIISAI